MLLYDKHEVSKLFRRWYYINFQVKYYLWWIGVLSGMISFINNNLRIRSKIKYICGDINIRFFKHDRLFEILILIDKVARDYLAWFVVIFSLLQKYSILLANGKNKCLQAKQGKKHRIYPDESYANGFVNGFFFHVLNLLKL